MLSENFQAHDTVSLTMDIVLFNICLEHIHLAKLKRYTFEEPLCSLLPTLCKHCFTSCFCELSYLPFPATVASSSLCCLSLISLRIRSLQFICAIYNGRIPIFWKMLNNICHRYKSNFLYWFIHPSTTQCFCVFAIVNDTAVNVGVQMPLWDSHFNSLDCITRFWVAGSCDSFIFNF